MHYPHPHHQRFNLCVFVVVLWVGFVASSALPQGISEDHFPRGHLSSSDLSGPLLGDLGYVMHPQVSPALPQPQRWQVQRAPKRLYFAPRLGKRSLDDMQSVSDGDEPHTQSPELRYRRDPAPGSDLTPQQPATWWWPLMSVRRSSMFSPRPGKRSNGQIDSLPQFVDDYLYGKDDYDDEREEEEEGEDVMEEDLDDKTSILSYKRGLAFSPRLGKRGTLDKKTKFAFSPRLGKKANLAFSPRLGKKSGLAFSPRLGKKANFAFAPRPGKKANLAFSPRLGKKGNFAFSPRPGKRGEVAGEEYSLWGDKNEEPPTTLNSF